MGLPNQPDRIALDPAQFMNDIVTGFARLQQQVAKAAVIAQADDLDRDRIAEWRKDGRDDAAEECAQ